MLCEKGCFLATFGGLCPQFLYIDDEHGTLSLCSLHIPCICHFVFYLPCPGRPLSISNVVSFPVFSEVSQILFSSSLGVGR